MKRKLLWGLLTLCLALLLAPIGMKEVSAATDRAIVMLVSPAEGPIEGGNTVIITGTNFEDVLRVKFGSTEATSYQVDSSTQITAIVPAKAAGQIIVSVDNNYDNGSIGNYYTYIDYAATNTTQSISYATIEDAMTAAASGDTIQILKDITLTTELSLNKDLTLDLNGHTITGNGIYNYVTVNGATVTVKDTATGGKITNSDNYAVLLTNAGNLNLNSGTVERPADYNTTIKNESSGTINISGGIVQGSGTDCWAILNETSGTVNISGGIVQTSGDSSCTIVNTGTGTVNISGGTVQTSGDSSRTIWNTGTGTVNISSGTVQSSGSLNYVIVNADNGIVNISGGLVQNNSGNYAIDNGTTGGSGVSIDASATIIGKLYPATTDPTATTILVTKTAASQASVDFTLTNIPSYSNGIGWYVYDAATGGNEVSDVTASNVGNTLTLTCSSTGLPASDYFVAAYDRASGYGESARLKLTVEYSVTVPNAPIIGTPTVNNNWISLSWTEPVNNGGSPITGYRIWYGSTNNIEDATEILFNYTGTVATITGNYGQTYYFWVKAVNSVGRSVASASASATTPISDITLVGNARTAIEGSTYTMTQATANNSTAVKAELASQINALSGMSSTGITVTSSNITLSAFTAANTGTSGTPAGTNGSFTFTVALAKGVVTDTTTAKPGTITATAYTGNSGNGGGNNGGGNTNANTTPKSEGIIEKTQQSEKDAPQVSINNSIDNLKESVFTAGEQAKVAAGENAKVTLKIEDISASVRVEDKKLIEEELRKVLQNTDTQGSEQQSIIPTMLYVDISLYKQIGSGEATKVTETNTKISISIEVPQELWNTDSNNRRTYRTVRVHNGVVEILDGTYDPKTHLFTFETDRFSTYALTYQDTTTVISTDPAKDELTAYNDFFHLQLTAKVTQTSQTISYAKMSGADGYLIYSAKYGKTLKKLADVSGTVISYTDKKLNKATCYKYQVKAYRIIEGKKVIIATSKVIYSYTTGKIYANPTKVTSDEASFKLTVGNSIKLNCQVVIPESMKLKEHTTLLRYETSDKVVATVGSTGKVTAKAKGTCYVYAYAQNGKYVKVKVTVE